MATVVTATFRKTVSDPRVCGKQFVGTGVTEVCLIYEPSSLMEPTLILNYNSTIFGDCNYCEIGAPFNRSYFMSPPVAIAGGRMRVTLAVDVLETYKSGIGALEPIVTRCEQETHPMLVDELVSAKAGYKNTWYTGSPIVKGKAYDESEGYGYCIVLEVNADLWNTV